MSDIYQSKWGFYPCDYITFAKLKWLHEQYWKAVRGLAKWFRWNAKQPQNRVLTEKIKDDKGVIIGRKIIGPQPEPQYCTLFGKPEHSRWWLTIPEHLNDQGIVKAYQQSRMPKKQEEVTPLEISLDKINELYDAMVASI